MFDSLFRAQRALASFYFRCSHDVFTLTFSVQLMIARAILLYLYTIVVERVQAILSKMLLTFAHHERQRQRADHCECEVGQRRSCVVASWWLK